MNLPNALTLARIFLVPIVVALLLTVEIRTWAFLGASLFLAAALTDLLDGYLARRRKQVTTLGRLLDPIADKLLISSALVALVQLKIAPAWMVAIIIGREFAVSGLRGIAAHEGFSIDVSSLGKGKMVTQVAAVVGLILGHKYAGWVQATANVLLWAVVFALVSMVQYFREFWSCLAPTSNIASAGASRSSGGASSGPPNVVSSHVCESWRSCASRRPGWGRLRPDNFRRFVMLSDNEKTVLLKLARSALESCLDGRSIPQCRIAHKASSNRRAHSSRCIRVKNCAVASGSSFLIVNSTGSSSTAPSARRWKIRGSSRLRRRNSRT